MGKLRFPKPAGYVAEGFEKVLKIYSENHARGFEKGSSFAAYYKGKLVVNVCCGLSDWEVKLPWKEETMGLFHSTTKCMAAVTMAHLVERNLIRYEDKISNVWPEFSQNGKDNITLEQILAHRAGLAYLSESFNLGWIQDNPKRLRYMLASQSPIWEPDTGHGYSPITFGLYLDEIVRRVDSKERNVSQYFHDEIAKPFDIDFHIGCPKSLFHRVARLEPVPLTEQQKIEVMERAKNNDIMRKAFSQPKDWSSSRKLNDPDFLALPVCSSHGVGTAAGVAKFMGILASGGEYEGKRLLSRESIASLQEPLSIGRDLTTGMDHTQGRGTWLIPVQEGDKSWYMFGHAGYGDQMGGADSHYETGFAYTTNQILPTISYAEDESRWRPLVTALFQCIHKLEGVTTGRRMFDNSLRLPVSKL